LVLTHINHNNMPHDELDAYVSQYPGVVVAYDGMSLEV
jgi:phosphoribosyl 1,2-cyclic phosphodiesterase